MCTDLVTSLTQSFKIFRGTISSVLIFVMSKGGFFATSVADIAIGFSSNAFVVAL